MAAINLFITKPEYLSQIPVRDGNIIFIEQSGQVCLDYHEERYAYETICTYQKDAERVSDKTKLPGYYFVTETNCFWYFDSINWTRITQTPENVISFVETDLPSQGETEILYISKKEQKICIWDKDDSSYLTVANCAKTISEEEISSLF